MPFVPSKQRFCLQRSCNAVCSLIDSAPGLAITCLDFRDKGGAYSLSNSDLTRPDCRMMLCRVPRLSSSWSGTGTVTVVSSVLSCMIEWLPRWRTATNPCCSRIRQTSEPDRTRSLPNGHLNLRDEDLSVQPACYFRWGSGLKKSVRASMRLARASSIVEPWLAMSSSGHNETKPSSSRSMIAVIR